MYEKAMEKVKELENTYRAIYNNRIYAFAILQLPIESPNKYKSFERLQHYPCRDDYNLVYTNGYTIDENDDSVLCGFDEIAKKIRKQCKGGDTIYGYHGIAIGVSDVIIIKYKTLRFAFYVDKNGFERIDGFDV
jgi:anaerobic ribonucleoside-triphosphate reductase